MKNKHGFILGFSIMLTLAIITLAGCASLLEMFKSPEFSSDLTGTWVRTNSPYNYTLTITSNTLKASNQNYYWRLQRASGDMYSLTVSGSGQYYHSTFKLVDDTLVISEDEYRRASHYDPEHDWTGVWVRK
jgi:hypothetical protein